MLGFKFWRPKRAAFQPAPIVEVAATVETSPMLLGNLPQHADHLQKTSANKPVSFKVAMFSAKPYEEQAFEHAVAERLQQAASPVSYGFDYFSQRLDLQSMKLLAGHEAVCTFVNDRLDKEVLQYLKEHTSVRLVLFRCAGYDRFDVNFSFATAPVVRGLRVPSYSPESVAEHTIALCLAMNRKLHKAHQRVTHGNFDLSGLTGTVLHGKTVGIIGMGNIGSIVAKLFEAFGCKVLIFSRSHPDAVPLEQLLANSDVISLHAPLTESTWHLINRETLQLCKQGVQIVNTGRGALMDTEAVLEALNSGRVSSLATDVYEREAAYFFDDHSSEGISDPVLAALIYHPNVLLTGHQAFLTKEALQSIADTTLQNLEDFLSGSDQENNTLTNEVRPDDSYEVPMTAVASLASAADESDFTTVATLSTIYDEELISMLSSMAKLPSVAKKISDDAEAEEVIVEFV